MPLNLKNKYEVISASKSFCDLRHLWDTKTVLENPHKGWYYHFIDNGLLRGAYRDKVTEVKRFKTPINHLYLRIDWSDIEKEEGKLDWSPIDKIMDEWGALGYKFSLRFCTYEGPFDILYATPKWVFDLGAKKIDVESKGSDGVVHISYEPVYDDSIFLEKLDVFLENCGKKFNSDPRVEFVDVGSFGTWGEGHTHGGSYSTYPAEVVKKHINLHLKHFSSKYVMLNDDFIWQAFNHTPEDASEIYDYALNKGLGYRDDSICFQDCVRDCGYDTLRMPTLFEGFAENAPVDIELCHCYHTIPERFKEGYPVIEALRHAHATYAGFHGYEEQWYEKSDYITDYLANRLGYWLFIDAVDPGTPSSGSTEITKVYVANRGFAKCYHKYDLKLRLSDDKGNTYSLNNEYPDSTKWANDTVTEEIMRLDYRKVPAGEYTMELGLFEGDLPIKLGIAQECLKSDGYYSLCPIIVTSL